MGDTRRIDDGDGFSGEVHLEQGARTAGEPAGALRASAERAHAPHEREPAPLHAPPLRALADAQHERVRHASRSRERVGALGRIGRGRVLRRGGGG